MGESTNLGDVALEEPPLPEGFDFVHAGESPLEAVAALGEGGVNQQGSAGEPEQVPLIEDPSDDSVALPGGLASNGEVFRKATVRELNGEDEEFLARALAANDWFRYQQVLLERGVTHLGPHKATPELLDSLVVGDRDVLILGIRIATYGPTLDMDILCQHCSVESKIRVDFSTEVPTKPLPFDIVQPYQLVDTGKGFATVRLATGADQRYLSTLENVTTAEVNTALLTRTVKEIDGEPVTGKADILRLGMGQRSKIVDWMADNQPGPEYEKVKHACHVCGKETPLGLSTGDLFRG
jgi:hypothetical protein